MLGHVGVNTIMYNVEDNSTLHKLCIPIVYIGLPSLCRMLLKCRQLFDSYIQL